MAARTYYTIQQLCFLLGGIDPKTLKNRLKAANIEMEPDPQKPTRLRLSRTDAKKLASFHKMTLLDDEELRKDPEQSRSLARIALEVEAVGQTLDALSEMITTRLVIMQQELTEHVDQRMNAVTEHIIQQVAQQVGYVLEEQTTNFLTEAQFRQALLEAQEEAQTFVQEQIIELQRSLPQAFPPGMLASVTYLPQTSSSPRPLPESSRGRSQRSRGIVESQSRLKGPASQKDASSDELPPGTVTVSSFARQHGTTRDMLLGVIDQGNLQAEVRAYQGTKTQKLFTPEQQDAAVKYLLTNSLPGHRCVNCPHAQ